MRILMLHSRYRTDQPSGENESTRQEAALLRSAGHEVELMEFLSDDLPEGAAGQVRAAWELHTSRGAATSVAAACTRLRPDVVHIQNHFPLIGYRLSGTIARRGIPVVQSVRNYRYFCASSDFFRAGQQCHLCVERSPLNGLRFGCYRGRAATVPLTLYQLRALPIQRKWVRLFLATSSTVARYLEAAGIPVERVAIRHNVVDCDADGPIKPALHRRGFLYAGRLDAAKGAELLAQVCERWSGPEPVMIVGEGPEERSLRERLGGHEQVEFRGVLSHKAVLEAMGTVRAVLVPSLWQEPFGRVTIEAKARGTPCLTTGEGALGELIRHEEDGFRLGVSPEAWVAAMTALTGEDLLDGYIRRSSARYSDEYSPTSWLARTEELYQRARLAP